MNKVIYNTSEDLKQCFDACLRDISKDSNIFSDTDNWLRSAYIYMFGAYPDRITIQMEGSYMNKDFAKKQHYEGTTGEYTYKDEIDTYTTYIQLETQLTNNNIPYYIIRNSETPVIITPNMFIYSYRGEITVLTNTAELPSVVKKSISLYEENGNTPSCEYATYNRDGFSTNTLLIKTVDLNVKENYNDDLPDDKIKEFLQAENESGLLILHGKPGTGKTTYIRNLIRELNDKDFLILDSSVFDNITDSSFIQLLLEYKDCVVILEDCESMLADRTDGNNKMASLLNLSDGILGDAFNLKFICTFNADINRIDQALLRKGRMKVKYEFKKLSKDKVKVLSDKYKLNIPEDKITDMYLSDIFNYNSDNGAQKDVKKIGF
jgi:hypothetical protein